MQRTPDSRLTLPTVGPIRPIASWASVDLPDPVGPTSAVTLPVGSESDTSLIVAGPSPCSDADPAWVNDT